MVPTVAAVWAEADVMVGVGRPVGIKQYANECQIVVSYCYPSGTGAEYGAGAGWAQLRYDPRPASPAPIPHYARGGT